LAERAIGILIMVEALIGINFVEGLSQKAYKD